MRKSIWKRTITAKMGLKEKYNDMKRIVKENASNKDFKLNAK